MLRVEKYLRYHTAVILRYRYNTHNGANVYESIFKYMANDNILTVVTGKFGKWMYP